MMKRKTALVTGSTSGIGLGIAEALAKQGANIVLNDLASAPRLNACAPAWLKSITLMCNTTPRTCRSPMPSRRC